MFSDYYSILTSLLLVSYNYKISTMLIQILVTLTLLPALEGKMVYMTELFRHGARYPLHDIWDGN